MDTREKDYVWLRTEGDYTAQCCTRLREVVNPDLSAEELIRLALQTTVRG